MTPPTDRPPDRARDQAPGGPSLSPPRGETREEFVRLARDYFALLKKNLIDFRRPGGSGLALVREYSRFVDVVVGLLFQRAVEEQGARAGEAGTAIVALGGYGRSELAPYSDVDILILCERRTPLIKQIASTFVQLAWDVGLELGHTVESLADGRLVESRGTLARHMDSRTALLESRFVCGSRDIARKIERELPRLRQKDREVFLRRKIADALSRHEKHSNSYQLVEPNVKLSPGGLRDYQTLVWLAMVSRERVGLSALRKKGLLLPGEEGALDSAYDFLLRVRFELHVATQSKQDQLTVAIQRAVAERLGYRDGGGHLAVELFMRDYYGHTRTVFRITDDVIDELGAGRRLGVLIGRGRRRRRADRLFLRIDRRRIRREPLYVFARQKETGLKLDRALKRRLETVLAQELSGRAERKTMAEAFPSLLSTGANLSLVLRAMHETGFLGAVIPEYDALTSLKRYDLYHHYTVDEHSFQVVRNLEVLKRPAGRRPDSLRRLYSEIGSKQVLYLTALLHDVGKIEGRGHARKGAALAAEILRRMSLDEKAIETVSHLIRIHLLMSHYSQRRDPADPGTIRAFCKEVGGRENLKLLCLLTYADLKATSPLVWTEWKQSLLWALYLRAYDFTAKKEKRPDAVYQAKKKALLRAFPEGPGRKAALAHLDLLPGRYLLTMKASHVKAHMGLIDRLDGERAVVSARRGPHWTEITFCTSDQPYRLSQLCGVLTLNDCNILGAYAFTRSDGKVIDVFQVEDFGGEGPVDASRAERMRNDLLRVMRGELDIQAALEKHLERWKRRWNSDIPVPVEVKFENDLSGRVTIIDIFAPDRPGLLFRITRALSEEGLTIHRAQISTEANRAIDSFDVLDRDGRKITDAGRLAAIRERLGRALG